MVTCADGTIYTGYTKDLLKRIEQHNTSKIGAKYTSTRRPVKLSYVEILSSQKEAIKRELELKKFSRGMKLDLIQEFRKNQFDEF